MAISDVDRAFLVRAIALAREALDHGDEPYGSVLVSGGGRLLFEDRNRVSSGDATRHPEFAIARWAAENVAVSERADCVVYTSGEHCPMCSAAHAMVGLGRIVFASSAAQGAAWAKEFGLDPSPAAPLPISTVAPGVPAEGPVPELWDEVRALHAARAN